jgi:hypothetical protein
MRPSVLLHTTIRTLSFVALLASATGCRTSTGSETDPTLCQQTYEFGNFGCSRLVAIVDPPPAPLPAAWRYIVRADPARPNSGMDGGFAGMPHAGANPIDLVLWHPLLPAGEDTVSMWIKARLLDQTVIVIGQPLPTFAVDSVLRVVRFAPVGSKAPVDTVHLALRRLP